MDYRCKLDILPPAQAELEEIARVHMALSGPQSARNITDRIYDAMDQLTRFPLSGPSVRDDELSAAGYRYILAGKYLMFYRLLGDTVVIYHIAHGASDYPKLLKTSFFS
jgi:toxin ParE1/3/4